MKTRSPRKQRTAWTFRPLLERLEARDVPAAPVIDPLTTVAPFLPQGKSIFLPITATDPQGEPLSFSVTSSNPDVIATIEPASNPFLKISVAGFGDMVFELFGDITPDTVSRISGLVKSGFYNGLTFHRIVPDFVIQGGDPNGNGTGGPGFTFNDEFNANAIYSGIGQLGLANTTRDTNGSQFFVTLQTERHLDFVNGVFGQLVRGFDVLKAINAVPTGANGLPTTPVVISNMSMIQDNHDAVLLLKTNLVGGVSTITVTAQNSDGQNSAPISFFATIVADSTAEPAFLNPVTNQSTPENTPLTFTVSGTELNGLPLTFNATTTSANATVTVNGNQITVTPKNGFVGAIPLIVSVTNGNGNPDTQNIVVAVGARQLTNATGSPFSGTEGQSIVDVPLGTFTDKTAGAAPGDYTVSITWGDRGTDTTTGKLTETSGGIFVVSGTHTYAQAGKYPVNVTVTLSSALGGNVATFTTTATVNEAAITAQGVTIQGAPGVSLTNQLVATVTDFNPNPILANFSAVIDWGDGSQPTPGVLQRAADGTLQVFGSHNFTAAGTFNVTATVRDSNSAGEVLDVLTTATSAVTIAAPTVNQLNQGFIAGLYRTDLRREANTNELHFWNTALNSGLTRFQIAYFVEISPEHRTLEISDLYTNLLGRNPTTQETLTGLSSLQGGGTLVQLKAHILASDEYFQNRAGGNQTTLLQVIAIDVLGAMLPQAQQNYYTWVFSTTTKREEAVLSLLGSLQAQVAAVNQDYQATLGHKADQGGAVQAVLLRQGGTTDEAIRALLLSSDEGFGRLSAAAFTETFTA